MTIEADSPTHGFGIGDVVRHRAGRAAFLVVDLNGPRQVTIAQGKTEYVFDCVELVLLSKPRRNA